MSDAAVRRIFERLQAENPEPETELHYSNSFELLVAWALTGIDPFMLIGTNPSHAQ